MKLGILVDSSSTYEPKDYDGSIIECIPLHITKNNGTDFLDSAENMVKFNVWEELKNGIDWKTSQASPGELEEKYDELLKKYDHIIHIPITTNLSSMYSTSVMVSRDDKFQGKVTVIENKNVAAQGIREVAIHLSKMIQENKLTTPEEVVKEFNSWSKGIYLGIIPGDLKKLAHGGRAVKVISSVLNIFKTKVLIQWDEEPKKEGFGRTINGLIQKVIDHIKSDSSFKNGYKIIFVKTPYTSDKLVNASKDFLKENKIIFTEEFIPNLYAIHAGIETTGYIVVPDKK